jgi:phosphohistidine phosphatase
VARGDITRHIVMPMNLLVIRHAIAEDKEEFAATGRTDDLRPLTEAGRGKMRRAAQGLRAVIGRISLLASSPLVRARETAEIVAPPLGVPRVEIVDALRPERDYDELVEWLRGRAQPNDDEDRTVAVVGHEPHLSGLVTWLMTGFDDSRLELKKGGACLLHFDDEPSKGTATLRWLLTPSQLRDLGD